ncbi:hypothetical protein BKG77_15865 [Mycobacteroides chelonae]|jgi:mannose-6-phosphate isomerase-like protein (cupin superfamily)|uniref:cupin domain-containing protein n=1 Tax=Mycobacteroides chelonae TaxID=1774 RepID=UPI0008AA0E11|nr:cupin domain-containing protein [Mycobacteroides chelonae]OHU24883.1 hypothetical protein BKG77_15865 [Mycobacteroides chelonae]
MTFDRLEAGEVPVVRYDDREVLELAGIANQTSLVLDSEATDGHTSVIEVQLLPGTVGAEPHYHALSGELFRIIDGQVQMLYGETLVTAAAGDTIYVPPRTVHAFRTLGEHTAHLLIVLMPGVQRFKFFRLLEEIDQGNASHADLLAVQEIYDSYEVESLLWRQACAD